MRAIVRRTHTQLGEVMLPALAMLAAPYAVAAWEFVEQHDPRNKVAHIDPSVQTFGHQCVGCGNMYFLVTPWPESLVCDSCRERMANGDLEWDEAAKTPAEQKA